MEPHRQHSSFMLLISNTRHAHTSDEAHSLNSQRTNTHELTSVTAKCNHIPLQDISGDFHIELVSVVGDVLHVFDLLLTRSR